MDASRVSGASWFGPKKHTNRRTLACLGPVRFPSISAHHRDRGQSWAIPARSLDAFALSGQVKLR
jgi:hypothetical protein